LKVVTGIVARVSCSPWVRSCYRWTQRVPALRGISHAVMCLALPFGHKVWAQVHAGAAKGLWLEIDPRGSKSYLEGYYELAIQDALQKYLHEGDVFYDIGAHVGYFSMIAARMIGLTGQVEAFEAAPENAAAMEQHIRRNGFTQIRINPVAVWSSCGSVSFRSPLRGGMAGTAVLPSGDSVLSPLDIDVKAITLDSLLNDHRPPTLIKMDVEGAEAEVLLGANKLFEKHRPALICEVHTPEAATSVQEWLASKDYTFEWITKTKEETLPRHLVADPRGRP